MDEISLSVLRSKLFDISDRLYTQTVDCVDASFELDGIIDSLDDWIEYLKNERKNNG